MSASLAQQCLERGGGGEGGGGGVSVLLLPRIMFGHASITWSEIKVAIAHLAIRKPPYFVVAMLYRNMVAHALARDVHRRESIATGKKVVL